MKTRLSRRDFLKLSGLALGSVATDWFPEGEGFREDVLGVGRVAIKEINIHRKTSYDSEEVGKLSRDQLFPIFEMITVPEDLPYSPLWYRVTGGYVHSAYVQRVEGRHINEPRSYVPEEGWLGEITVPYSRAYRMTDTFGWVPVYRLYYQSVHWVTGVEEGRDGRPWYKIEDELLHVHYHVPAHHVRIIPPSEVAPISPDVPWEDKRVEVSIEDQILTAYERDEVVLQTLISSGIPGLSNNPLDVPTATPRGDFNVDVKMPSKHMGNGELSADIHAYVLPGVPWVCFFHETGAAFHGTYWHDNFAYTMSHGCVNMTMEDAKWLYRWTLPEIEAHTWEERGFGTRVTIY